MLANSPNKVLSREDLLDNIWGTEYFGDPRTVDTHIKRLRARLKLMDNIIGTLKLFGLLNINSRLIMIKRSISTKLTVGFVIIVIISTLCIGDTRGRGSRELL